MAADPISLLHYGKGSYVLGYLWYKFEYEFELERIHPY